ncbi:MAG: AAA family ATPase [Coprococcus sp.]
MYRLSAGGVPPLYLDMKVLEYLEFAADLKGIPAEKKEAEIRKVMGMMTKLMEVSERLINQSVPKDTGRGAGLAQAMLGFPEILILDEPTVGLDPKQIIEIRELIRKLAKDHTVILSSHILARNPGDLAIMS